MSRIKQAWQALTGTLDREIRYLPDPESWGNVYAVHWRKIIPTKGGPMVRPSVEYFSSCQQALVEHPDKAVQIEVAVHFDGRTFTVGGMTEIQVQPKPKRAKGKP